MVIGKDDDKIDFYSSGSRQYRINNADSKDCRDLHFYSNYQRYVGACKEKGVIVTNST